MKLVSSEDHLLLLCFGPGLDGIADNCTDIPMHLSTEQMFVGGVVGLVGVDAVILLRLLVRFDEKIEWFNGEDLENVMQEMQMVVVGKVDVHM